MSDKTIQGYRDTIMKGFKALEQENLLVDPKRMERDHVDVILDKFQMRKNYVLRFQVFLNYLGNPVLRNMRLRFPPDPIKVDWLSPRQAEMVIRSAKTPKEKLIIHEELELLFRRVEALRFRMVDEKEGSVMIHGKGKYGGKWRTIAKHPLTDAIFQEWKDCREEIIFNQREIARKKRMKEPTNPIQLLIWGRWGRVSGYGPNSETAIDNILHDVSSRCGIHFGNHTLRRTGGRNLHYAGVPIVDISKVMGHTDPRVTMRYLGLEIDDLTEGMKKLHAYQMKVRQEMYLENPSQTTPDA